LFGDGPAFTSHDRLIQDFLCCTATARSTAATAIAAFACRIRADGNTRVYAIGTQHASRERATATLTAMDNQADASSELFQV